jgi:hypothetical protein
VRERLRLLEQENEVLRRAAACLSQANLPGGGWYPLVAELAGSGVPVTVTCRVIKLSRQPYYRWLKAPVTDTEVVEGAGQTVLYDAHRDDPEFGYRLLADDEARTAGEAMVDWTAWRICPPHSRRQHTHTRPTIAKCQDSRKDTNRPSLTNRYTSTPEWRLSRGSLARHFVLNGLTSLPLFCELTRLTTCQEGVEGKYGT